MKTVNFRPISLSAVLLIIAGFIALLLPLKAPAATAAELAAAVDNPVLSFTSEGADPWTVAADPARVGGSVARSGDIAAGQTSTLTTAVTGPALLSFDWKTVSPPGYGNYLNLIIDGVLQEKISDSVDWRQRLYPLGSGSHTISWVYQQAPSFSGAAIGWLDNIKVTDCAGVDMGLATATIIPSSLTLPFTGTGNVSVAVSDGTTNCSSAAAFAVYPRADLNRIPVVSQTVNSDWVPLYPSLTGDVILQRSGPGALDAAFSADGIAVTAGTSYEKASLLYPANDSSIFYRVSVIAGNYTLQRFNTSDGTPLTGSGDGLIYGSGFDADGLVYLDTYGNDSYFPTKAALQSDGRIVVMGYPDNSGNSYILFRLWPDGTLDSAFGTSGGYYNESFFGYTEDAYIAIVKEPLADQDKIIIGVNNYGEVAVARYLADGSSPDYSGSGFGPLGEGTYVTSIGSVYLNDMALDSAGNILLAGEEYSVNTTGWLMRLTSSGVEDTTFGAPDGYVTFSNGIWDDFYAVAAQPDGKIVVAGESDDSNNLGRILVIRYLPDGTIDSSFAGGGFLYGGSTDYDFGDSIVLQPNGKVVVGGTVWNSETSVSTATIIRLNGSDGTLDTGFGLNGVTSFSYLSAWQYGDVNNLAFQPDGKIAVSGYIGTSNFILRQIGELPAVGTCGAANGTASATPPPTTGLCLSGLPSAVTYSNQWDWICKGQFGSIVDATCSAPIAIQPQTISFNPPTPIANGSTLYLNAYASSTSGLPLSFSITGPGSLSGSVLTATGLGDLTVTISQPGDGLFYLPATDLARTITVAASALLPPAGSPNPYFNTGAFVVTPGSVTLAAAQSPDDLKIVAAGHVPASKTMFIGRYNGDGSVDNSFRPVIPEELTNKTGPTEVKARAVAFQSDGKILVAGNYLKGSSTTMMLIRYNPDGSLDTGFGANGLLSYSHYESSGVPPQANTEAYSIALDGTGNILVVGDYNGMANVEGLQPYNGMFVVRASPAGVPDSSYADTGKVSLWWNSARSVALQPDGMAVVAGYSFDSYTGISTAKIWRFDQYGFADAGFNAGTGEFAIQTGDSDVVLRVAVQPDGRIVASGSSTTAGVRSAAVWRVFSDGSGLDTTFGPNGLGGFNGFVNYAAGSGVAPEEVGGLILQPDGKIVAASYTTSLNGDLDALVLRYRPDGAPDMAFGTDGVQTLGPPVWNDAAAAVLLPPDGNLVVAGYNTNPPNVQSFLTRLNGIASPVILKIAPPGPYDFGSFEIPASWTASLTINNYGDSPLLVSDIVYSGSTDFTLNLAPDVTSPCFSSSPVIAAGDYCELSVNFAPLTAGVKSGAITVTSNDPANSTVVYTVTGTGTPDITPPTDNATPATAAAGIGSVALSWYPATDASGIAYYKVARSTTATPADCSTGTSVGDVTGYMDANLTIGTTYYYRICAVDASVGGNVSTGLIASATPVDQNNALHFDGLDDYVDVSNLSAWYLSPTFTMETWLRPDTTAGDMNLFQNYGCGLGCPTISFTVGREMGCYAVGTPGKINFFMTTENGSFLVSQTSPLSASQWAHASVTYDGANLSLYINGILEAVSPATGTPLIGSPGNVGADPYCGPRFQYQGALKEFRLWNIGLTVTDVSSRMNSTLTGSEPGLTAYYPFNQGIAGGNNSTETSLLDIKGAQNGLLNNFALIGSTSNWIASTAPVAVNGVCGSSNSQTMSVAPAANLCWLGTPSPVAGTGPWTWSCTGANGGTTAACATIVHTYTVTYNGNGNTGGSVPTDSSSPYLNEATVTVLANAGALVKNGHAFAGWNTAVDGSGTSFDPGSTFAMGSGNVILYAQWTALKVSSIVIDPVDLQKLYAGIDGAGVYSSLNSGADWTAAVVQPTNLRVQQLLSHPTVAGTLYVATYGGGVFASTDSGGNWSACANAVPGSQNAHSLAIDPFGKLYAGTEAGVFSSPDCSVWSLKSSNLPAAATTPVNVLRIDPAAPSTLYAGLDGAGVYKSSNSGDNWTAAATQPANPRVKALVIKPGESTKLFAATYGGGVFQSSDSGVNWNVACATQPANRNLMSLVVDASGKLYAGTEAGVFVSEDDCGSWTALNTGLPN